MNFAAPTRVSLVQSDIRFIYFKIRFDVSSFYGIKIIISVAFRDKTLSFIIFGKPVQGVFGLAWHRDWKRGETVSLAQ